MDGWHAGDSGSAAASASHRLSGEDMDGAGDGGGEGYEMAEFEIETDDMPNKETFRDALIFLIDCSSLMQFPCDEMDANYDVGVKVDAPDSLHSADAASGGAARSSYEQSASHSSGAGAAASSEAGSRARAAASAASAKRDTQFQMVMRVVAHSLRRKIVSNPDDMIGIILFGTKKSKCSTGNPNHRFYVYAPCDYLTASTIRDVDRLLDVDYFNRTIGAMEEKDVCEGKLEMDLVFQECSQLFKEIKDDRTKRIMILTNNDQPYNILEYQNNRGGAGVTTGRDRIIYRAKDLSQSGIGIDLIAVGKKPTESGLKPTFYPSFFYKEILAVPEDEADPNRAAVFHTKFSELRQELYRKVFRKRSLGSIPFFIRYDDSGRGQHVALGVKVYCMLRESKKEAAIFVDKSTNEKLTTHTGWIDARGEKIATDRIQKYQEYGGIPVVFKDEEISTIKTLGEPGLVLLGFKRLEALKPSHNIKNAYFLYPDNNQYADSDKAFRALMNAMLKKGKFAVCRLIQRKGGMVRIVALQPQPAQIDKHTNEMIAPPGFQVIFLPYADDIRHLKFEATPIAPKELVEQAKKVVLKLTVPSLPSIPNPALQKHYRILQAMALQEPPPDESEFEDQLLPDTEGMNKYKHFMDSVDETATDIANSCLEAAEPVSRKRKAEPGAVKKEVVKHELSFWKNCYENDTLKKCTVPELKEFCREHKLPLAGKKEDLLERVEIFLAS